MRDCALLPLVSMCSAKVKASVTHALHVCMQVLIFSQFKIMLDVLEDFLRLADFPFERIDGSVSQRDREAAINRYSKGAPALLLSFFS